MNRRTPVGALALGLLACRIQAAPSSSTEAHSEPLRVGVMVKDPESWVGSQLMAHVYAAAGLTPTFVPMPPARAGIALVSGDVDADLMRIARFGALRRKLVRVPTPFCRFNVIAASLATRHATVRSREDLRAYRLGAVSGYFFVQELAAGHPSLTLTQSTQQLVRMLAAGHLEVAIDTQISMQYTLRRMGTRGMEISAPLMTLELYHYLHPRHAALAPRLDEALRAMIANGKLAHLTQRFEAEVMDLPYDKLL